MPEPVSVAAAASGLEMPVVEVVEEVVAVAVGNADERGVRVVAVLDVALARVDVVLVEVGTVVVVEVDAVAVMAPTPNTTTAAPMTAANLILIRLRFIRRCSFW
jgi:hypothetical protein